MMTQKGRNSLQFDLWHIYVGSTAFYCLYENCIKGWFLPALLLSCKFFTMSDQYKILLFFGALLALYSVGYYVGNKHKPVDAPPTVIRDTIHTEKLVPTKPKVVYVDRDTVPISRIIMEDTLLHVDLADGYAYDSMTYNEFQEQFGFSVVRGKVIIDTLKQ